jgi:hypothetical protein
VKTILSLHYGEDFASLAAARTHEAADIVRHGSNVCFEPIAESMREVFDYLLVHDVGFASTGKP